MVDFRRTVKVTAGQSDRLLFSLLQTEGCLRRCQFCRRHADCDTRVSRRKGCISVPVKQLKRQFCRAACTTGDNQRHGITASASPFCFTIIITRCAGYSALSLNPAPGDIQPYTFPLLDGHRRCRGNLRNGGHFDRDRHGS